MTTPTMHLDCDGFADALADYLEGDASESVRSAMDAHAASCPACAQLLADLRDISTDAAALPLLTPSRDLWSGIAERIDARVIPLEAPSVARSMVRRTWLRPALAAAAIVVVTASITHYATRRSLSAPAAVEVAVVSTEQAAPATAPPGVATEPASAISPPVTAPPAERRGAQASPKSGSQGAPQHASATLRLASTAPGADVADPVFNSEISKLRQIVRERRSQLDPKTVAVLEQSIAVMDSAIAQSRAALRMDPASGFLATQLNRSLEKKVELLRMAALLPSRT
ncbi:MAG: zf-HC2 domain-containing protein [Gemmatimonadota bacterium]|nr:zf-HC2 domain-containing protein [Gemmatimonadota bacterium]